eukprot:5096686-Pyramimonas_sp.AAC.2
MDHGLRQRHRHGHLILRVTNRNQHKGFDIKSTSCEHTRHLDVFQVMDLWLKDGAPAAFVKKQLPIYIALFSNGFGYLGGIPFIRSLINFIVYLVRKVCPACYPANPSTLATQQTLAPCTFRVM